MATIATELIKSVGAKISGNHTQNSLNTAQYYVQCSSDLVADKNTATSVFSLPSLNFARTSVITALKLTTTTSMSEGAEGGHSCCVMIDGIAYDCDGNGYLNSNGISYLNSYKAQNMKFPKATVQVTSWVGRPPANDDGTVQTHYHFFSFSNCTLAFTLQGGVLTLVPNADISIEHTVPAGYQGVFQLVNDNNDDTYVGAMVTGGYDTSRDFNLTSVLSLTRSDFAKKSVVVLRPVSRHLIKTQNNLLAQHWGEAACSVIVGEESESCSVRTDTAGKYVTYDKWCLDQTSSIVQAINSYTKSTGVLPEIRLGISTSGYSSGGIINGGEGGVYITQAYLDLIYEDVLDIGVSCKVNSEWKSALAAYQKRNSTWVEIPGDECKAILAAAPVVTR